MRTSLAAAALVAVLAVPSAAQQPSPADTRPRALLAVDSATAADDAVRPLAAAFTAALLQSARRDTTLRLLPTTSTAAPDQRYFRLTSAWRREGDRLLLEWVVRDGRTSEPRFQRMYEMLVPASGTVDTERFARDIIDKVATFARLASPE